MTQERMSNAAGGYPLANQENVAADLPRVAASLPSIEEKPLARTALIDPSAADSLARVGIRLLSADDLRSSILERVDLVRGLLPPGVAVLYGAPSAGKSLAAATLALHVGAGIPFAGLRTRRAPVLYLACESAAGAHQRLEAARQRMGLEVPLTSLVAVADASGFNLSSDEGKAAIAGLVASLSRNDADAGGLLVIDTLAAAAAGINENDNGAMSALLKPMKRLADEARWTALILHHTGKPSRDGSESVERGASSIRADAEAMIRCKLDRQSGIVTLSADKLKDGPLANGLRFEIAPVHLGVDKEGEAVCVPAVRFIGAVPPASAQAPQQPPGKGELRVQDLLAVVGESAESGSMDEAAAKQLFLQRVMPTSSPDARKKAYQRAKADAVASGYLKFVGGKVFLTGARGQGQETLSPACPVPPVSDGGQGTGTSAPFRGPQSLSPPDSSNDSGFNIDQLSLRGVRPRQEAA